MKRIREYGYKEDRNVQYIAHRAEDGREQSVLAHLQGTAALARKFAGAFGAEDEGERCGMLHDDGKYSDAFQRRIRGSPESVDHSTAGAQEAAKLGDTAAAFCVAGHHGGLPDGGTNVSGPDDPTLKGRLKRKVENYDAFHSEVKIPEAKPPAFVRDVPSAGFFIRMLYSCLVDGDYLDTETFMQNGAVEHGGFPPLADYREKLRAKISPWLAHSGDDLNGLRSKILHTAVDAGKEPAGFFTLTAPTGSGKTIASMSFALEHAAENGLRRVIYSIPYCSIIEQTQSVFEDIFGEGSVVAHYADVRYKTDENSSDREKNRDKRHLAAENWDAPVILTTTVQFFESLFADKPSRCRKLHNIAGSVLIFDEAQMLPAPFLRPCVAVISELVKNYGCTAVLCTATQPVLEPLFRTYLPEISFCELCPKREEMYERFRRVRYEYLGRLSDEELGTHLAAEEQVLCVVNRRAQAQTLFSALPEEGRFHLSTAMCPAHRRAVLAEIRRRLDVGEPCRVVSTSLIEAGVDVDFPTVFRALAGLDSVVQAGGRCNREGRRALKDSTVYIFESEQKAPRMIAQNVSAARFALGKGADPAAPETIAAYFKELFYTLKGEDALDAQDILKLCGDRTFPFREIDERFQIIPNVQKTVYIRTPESAPLLDELAQYGPSRALMRKLGAYAVGVYEQHYQALSGVGALDEIAEDAAVLLDSSLYSPDTGLELTVEEGQALIC